MVSESDGDEPVQLSSDRPQATVGEGDDAVTYTLSYRPLPDSDSDSDSDAGSGSAPAWPVDDEGTACHFCSASPAAWVFELDEHRLRTEDGGFALPGGVLLTCERCRELVLAGETDALVDLQTAADGVLDLDWVRQVAAATLRARKSDGRRLEPQLDPPELGELIAAGFEPLDGYTGADAELGPVWPAEHAEALPDRRRWAEEGDLRWYVRSPWPSVRLPEILSFLWSYVELPPSEAERPLDRAGERDRHRRRMVEVLGWDETRARQAADEVARSD